MFRIIDSLSFTVERLWQHRALVFWALIGLIAATTLAMSLWLYVDAVNTRLLTSRLTDPPYAFRFRYLGAWNGNITGADVTSVTAAVHDRFTQAIGLPTTREVHFARGAAWNIRRNTNQQLGAFSVGTLDGASDQMKIVSGEWPPQKADKDVIPVLLSDKMLYTMGLQVGDKLTVNRSGAKAITLQVAALWTPVNDKASDWIFPPKFFDQIMLVQADDFTKAIEGIQKPIEECAWYVTFNGTTVKTSDVNGLLGRIVDGQRDVTDTLSAVRMDLAPVDGLNAFNDEVNRLTQQLIIMILPVAGLVFYFVSLVAGLLVSRQQQEDVTLRSRGMSRSALLGLHFMMWLLLTGLALGVAIAVSPLLVRLIGQTTSFMHFDDLTSPLVAVFSAQAILAGAATGLIAASSGLFMAWRSTRQTITSFRRESARASKAWWQRMYLDILLLIPAVYTLFTLWRQGGLVSAADDPFSNPLNFLGPTLFSLSFTMLFLRLWPALLAFIGKILSYTSNMSLLMALRELTRSIGRYRGTLLMMCFTLSLSGYTASMASTIDRSLEDSVNYKIGADSVLVVTSDTQTDDTSGTTVTGYTTLPADDLLRIDGVTNVSRAGRYSIRLILATQRIDGTILGIDRADMAAVTRFRQDYADESAGALFNRLAGNRTGVILNEAAATKYKLRIGQEVKIQVSALNTWYDMTVPIVGLVNYFPTLDPSKGFFMIANIDPIFEAVGTELPNDYWLSLKPGANISAIRQAASKLGFPILQWLDPESALETARAAPSRRGVLGFLSVGFVAAIFLTLIGAIVQSAASFRAQAAQLGSLRAMGLGSLSVGAYLIYVQGMAAISGILSGTSIGVITTLLFLPLLDFSGGLPPYLVRVAWSDITVVYAVFSGALFFVTLLTTMLLGRERVTTIVKLGDA